MSLNTTLILHSIISWVILTALIYRKAVPNLIALFRENINFERSGFGYYAFLFLVERVAQVAINYMVQFALYISIGLPYFHRLPEPWYWLMPLSFFLILPICGWTRFYRSIWHNPVQST